MKLSDLCTKASSNIAQKDIHLVKNGYPIYGASGLIGYVDFYKMDKPYIAVVKDGAGVGRIMKLPAQSSVIGTMQYIIPFDNIDIDYLAFALEHMNLSKYCSGATIPHIYFKDYQQENLNLPCLTEQRKISMYLNNIGNLIIKRKQQLAKLDELVKSRFIELFGGDGYPEVRLGDVCTKITDGTHKTPIYLTDGITFISAKNIINGELDFTDVKYISNVEYEEIQKRCKTEVGDILMSKSGSLGMPAIVRVSNKLGLFESLAVIKYDRERLLPEFLCEQLRSEKIQRQFASGTKGVAIKHLHLGVISETVIKVPPLEKQQIFTDFVAQTDKSKLAVQKSLEKLEMLKKSLMQKYFG